MHKLTGAFGIVFFVALAWIFSADRKKFPWRTVIAGIVLQLLVASFLLQSSFGGYIFQKMNVFVVSILSHGRKGAELIFGALSVPPGETGEAGEKSLGYFLFFQGFPVIIFVASLMAILYYLRIMPRIVELFARVFSRIMCLSGAESLVPERRKDLVRLGPRALLAANLACFQTAAVAGLCLSTSSSMILGGVR